MAFRELATNAVKYGALSSASGRLQVCWSVGGLGDNSVLVVDWCELGGPALDVQSIPGFGSRLLRRIVTKELAGQLDLQFKREGECCAMTIRIGSANQQ